MNEVTESVTRTQIYRLRDALVDAIENAQDLLSTHDAALGRDTKKNTFIAEMYEGEIFDCTRLIEELTALVDS